MSPPRHDPMPGIMAQIDQTIQKIQHLLESLTSFLNRMISTVINPFGDDEISKAMEKLQGITEQIGKFFSQTGNPIQLWEKADAWTNTVQKIVSPEVGKYTLGYKEVDGWWTGGGAKEYKDTLRPQKVALTSIADSAAGVSKELAAFAQQVVTYWTTISKEFVDTYTQMAKDAAAIASPDVVQGIAGLVLDLAAAINRLVMGFVDKYAEFETSVKGLETIGNDSKAFPGGHWPRPGSNLDGTWTQEEVG